MTEINFKNIRKHRTSQEGGFEELCCQLFSLQSPEPNALWMRKNGAGGDAGVEAYWTLPNENEHALQAKYFFKLEQSQRTQLTKSVKAMLEKHPNCTKYIICIPFNLGEQQQKKKWSQKMHWNKLVKGWQKLDSARNIEFELWDETKFTTLLSEDKPEFNGRRHYWFNEKILNKKWFRDRFSEAKSNLGQRYTPEMNVDLPLSKTFAAIRRSNSFWNDLADMPDISEIYSQNKPLNLLSNSVLKKLDEATKEIQKAALNKELNQKFKQAEQLIKKAVEEVEQFDISSFRDKSKREECNQFLSEVRGFKTHLKESKIEFANSQAILLLGDAGVGKSHILADTAQDALNNGQPAILLLGQQLKTGQPWDFVLKALDFNGTSEDFLGALDACAQAHDCKALFAVDALNEGNGKNIWPDELAGFVERVKKFPNIILVTACRTSYEKRITKNLAADQMRELTHRGFRGHEQTAAAIYMDKYGISRPDAPFLDPEFSNPLFLKTICETLKLKKQTRFPKGLKGITQIFEFYIKSISDSIENRLELDPRQNLVKKTINTIIEGMLKDGNDYLYYDQAIEITDSIFQSNGDEERNLVFQLSSEGILAEDVIYIEENDDNGVDVIRLSYERYLDLFRAKQFIEQYISKDTLKSAFAINGSFRKVIEESIYKHTGFIEALSIQIPEKFDVELYGLIEFQDSPQDEHYLKSILKEGFKNSLLWRNPKKANNDTLTHVNKLFNGMTSEIFEIFVRCAATPNHLLNAKTLHRNLIKKKMPDRDALWTVWISQNYYEPNEDEPSSIWTLVDWAWSDERETLNDEQVYLTCLTLAWLFCSPYRPLRDQATKAMAALVGSRTHIIRRLLLEFDAVDDLYVLERIYAVAYSTALAATPEELVPLARTVVNRIFRRGKNCDHILMKEYAIGIIQHANQMKVLPSNFQIEDVNLIRKNQTHIKDFSPDYIENLKDQVGRAFWSVMSGDFGTYTMNDIFHFSPTELRKNKPETWSEITQKFRIDVIKRRPQTKILFSSFDNALIAESIESEKRFRSDGDLVKILLISPDSSEEAYDSTQVSDKYDKEAHEAAKQQLETAKEALLSEFTEVEKEAWRWHHGGKSSEAAKFSRRLAKRWVLNRVTELGWKKELFEDFERYNVHSGGRMNHNSERMGKKYQWIAYHELLAKLSRYNHYLGGFDGPEPFQGAWQLGRRDIDPSLLIRGKSKKLDANRVWWEAPLPDVSEEVSYNDAYKWIRDINDLPSNFAGLRIKNKDRSQEFYILDTYHSAKQKKVGMDTYSRSFSKSISTAIVPAEQAPKILRACRNNETFNIFKNPQEYSADAFIGEYPWHESWYPIRDFFVVTDKYHELPESLKIHYPIRQYSCEASGYDKSVEESVYMNLPSQHLIDGLNLEFDRYNPSVWKTENKVIFLDPASGTSHQSSALIDMQEFSDWLKANNLVAVSAITSFKQYYHPMSPDDFPGELTDCQLSVYDGEKLTGERWTILTEMGTKDTLLRKPFIMKP